MSKVAMVQTKAKKKERRGWHGEICADESDNAWGTKILETGQAIPLPLGKASELSEGVKVGWGWYSLI